MVTKSFFRRWDINKQNNFIDHCFSHCSEHWSHLEPTQIAAPPTEILIQELQRLLVRGQQTAHRVAPLI